MKTNKGADSGAACLAALLEELKNAEESRTRLTTVELVGILKRRGFTKDAVGRAFTKAESIGKIEIDPEHRHERYRRQVRHDLGTVMPPGNP